MTHQLVVFRQPPDIFLTPAYLINTLVYAHSKFDPLECDPPCMRHFIGRIVSFQMYIGSFGSQYTSLFYINMLDYIFYFLTTLKYMIGHRQAAKTIDFESIMRRFKPCCPKAFRYVPFIYFNQITHTYL